MLLLHMQIRRYFNKICDNDKYTRKNEWEKTYRHSIFQSFGSVPTVLYFWLFFSSYYCIRNNTFQNRRKFH